MYIKKEILEQNKIDLDQYEVLKNIDLQIKLNFEMIEKLKQLKKALFIQKLTNENILFEVTLKDESYFLNEEKFNKLKLNDSYNSNYSFHKYDIGKMRLKKLEV